MSNAQLRNDFNKFREKDFGEKKVLDKLLPYEKNISRYLEPWLKVSKNHDDVYPSQGLLLTPFDALPVASLQMLPQEKMIETLRMRLFFLELFNHPHRMGYLKSVTGSKFLPPAKIECGAFDYVAKTGMSLSIGDLGASVTGSDRDRISRTERYAQGPFVKLGRQGRNLFVGSASPDVWNSSLAVATMAASHSLAGIPRNGVLSKIVRQADLAREVFERLDELEELILAKRADRRGVSGWWKNNVVGTLETNPITALERANSLYKAGVRSFRVYSPEPGLNLERTTMALRKEFGQKVEMFSGQVVDVDQAKRVQEAGADGLFVGVGGGGRCVTGVRSGSVIDWPELVWGLRGELLIPIIVEGGASDHVATSLLLGASGISVSRVVAGGTIESPGGMLFCSDEKGRLFKPYGGEASARTKFLDGKLLPFTIPSFVEGETTKAEMSYVKNVLPTLTYNLHMLTEDAILAMVFRGAKSVSQLQAINPSPLRLLTGSGRFQMNTH
ncbi:MAG: Inosine-5'-monophosphate dehydrogenase [Candidatus Amesbacteria bacterium GW2011_GWB1_47_26]|uniref:Inosine-5'-monophosphate dehydrogenase n=1 Tax=Candidatus Amesbacteria bacterium GW2011_GWC2_45_19 TaxID=1618366 RepID=A0A0G1Q3P8_9BACT|nr:MAG: Inosine-5'-monophosphate dehydrogenase [Candidatus Amesbacteria bacterium GW2011_GWC2_45_19]KKU37569.1 MAG: Inosine-5'-monophosphate dehydrogenase [Candidatus Amesbacteria bacterium GW2011_GWA1_46_35]KKU68939.1 MAG: Inosine-5'-monophosphate dehydrogenase [Microgenomates group bacterium GW2011_GWC1_47_20]KKU74370.1 MAG: Inosine-5'-monophosphate dehydrogenase [Candidatus Amesbacteria bacterium GW2011_GWB1_47_26]KKU78774.1 MAG: Inosine-5'-monophosphate dehydrogenase [Candidatus Amesbacteri